MSQLIPSGPERVFNGVNNSAITALNNGTFLAVWGRSKAAGGNEVVGQILNADGSLSGAAFVIDANAGAFVPSFTATALSNGRFVVAWLDFDGTSTTLIKSRIFKADAKPAGDIITVGYGGELEFPKITALDGGRYAISYANEGKLRSSFFDSEGNASSDEVLSEKTSMPSVATLTTGAYVTISLAPAADDQPGSDLWAYIRTPTSIKKVTLLHLDDFSSPPSVTALTDGRFLVVWDNGSSAGNQLKAQIFDDSGRAVGGGINVYQKDNTTLSSPVVKTLSDGGFAIAFMRFDTQSDVLVATYSKTGALVNSASVVGQKTADSQEDPSIAALADGRYVVSWVDKSSSETKTAFQIFDSREAGINLAGTDEDDQFIGTSYGDTLSGGGGDDLLYGYGGNDILIGGSGRDTLIGGKGDDIYYLTPGDVVIEEHGGGRDTIIVGYSATLGNDTEVEVLQASTGTLALTLGGANMNDTLIGNDGANTLDGGSGNDTMQGGGGNDVYYVDSAGDLVVETASGGASDKVITSVSYTLADHVEQLVAAGSASISLTGTSAADTITGNEGANVIAGAAGADTIDGAGGDDNIDGGLGADAIIGGLGNDTITGGADNDTLDGAGGDDKIDGGLGADAIIGGLGNDTITGGADNDTIDGGFDNDVISGGLGKDVLTGGAGKDTFLFDAKLNAKTNLDQIVDFNVKDDTIQLAKSVFSKITKKGFLAKTAFWVGAKAHDKDDRIIYDKKKGVLYYDADGDGKGAAVAFATVSKNLKMTEKDFFIV
ncbi:calcium-binding protein [Microvirga alba]|uniref:Calcium-binding protein n=1 Tax=Microvirga alba TaxID=2791025 RepID=A0A931FUK5_9HYPH|nr:calcium-binding protein [Microvirga alba]MBF9235701.1 calcium-binding protein [Microvirga alba]